MVEGAENFAFYRDGARFAGYLFHPGALRRAIAGGACGGRNGARSQRRAAGRRRKKMGTVGAVARDKFGSLAAAAITGGMTNKLPGRVGDSRWSAPGVMPATPASPFPVPEREGLLFARSRLTISPH